MKFKSILYDIMNIPNRLYNYILLKRFHVQWGKNLLIRGRIFCVANSKNGIILDNNIIINSSRGSNPIGGDSMTILFAKGNGKIRIGNNCGISNSTIFSCDSISIGNNVLIGGSVKIYDTDFHWLDYKKRISEKNGKTAPVVIKDGVFIGGHSIIMKGVTIGERSIIGAGSVVTRDIPSNEIWAGNPARFIRKNLESY